MKRPAPLWPAWLGQELAPYPGRWTQALMIGTSATAALAIVLTLQIASFPAPLIAFKALLPTIVCSWGLLIPRLTTIIGASLVVVPAIGVLVQIPWLMLPALWAALAVFTYLAPVDQSPIRGYCAAITIAALSYSVIFAPSEVGWSAVTLTSGFVVGLLVATTVAELRGSAKPHARLSSVLAEGFEGARLRLREAGARYRELLPAESRSAAGAQTAAGTLSQHLLLFDLVRQEHRAPATERAFVALITAAERIETYVGTAEVIARQPAGDTYRRLLDAELAALLEAIDQALARFADAARRPDCVLSSDAAPDDRAGPWPDLGALVTALRTRQRGLREAGQLSTIDVEESSRLNAFTQALVGLADVLHSPPEALEHHAPEVPARRRPAFDPYAAQFAMKVSLACIVALLIGVAAHAESLTAVVLTPLLLVQGSYGATLHRASLRIIGVVIGGLLAVATAVAIMPNTGDVTIWLLVVFAIMVPSAYIVLGTPRLSYLGLQIAITYLIVMVDPKPVVEIHGALWRFFATLLGTAIILAVFQIVRPDYAGRQIIARFRDLLRRLLTIVPAIDRPLPPVDVTQRCSDEIITGLAAVLRLAEETRYEQHGGGIDHDAAVEAAGMLRRVTHRWALIRRARRAPRPPLPSAVHDAVAALEVALGTHLHAMLALLEARHHPARPGSAAHQAARAAAAAVTARPLPDLEGPLQALEAAVAAARRGAFLTWPIDAASSVLAELDHFRRLAGLTPELGISLTRMSLPPIAQHTPALAGVALPNNWRRAASA